MRVVQGEAGRWNPTATVHAGPIITRCCMNHSIRGDLPEQTMPPVYNIQCSATINSNTGWMQELGIDGQPVIPEKTATTGVYGLRSIRCDLPNIVDSRKEDISRSVNGDTGCWTSAIRDACVPGRASNNNVSQGIDCADRPAAGYSPYAIILGVRDVYVVLVIDRDTGWPTQA